MDWLEDIEIVMFDLDGTLYQDDTFYKRYMAHLLRATEHEAGLSVVLDEMSQILKGSHYCRIGDWYHPGRNIWMRLFHDRAIAFDWKGAPAKLDLHALEGSRKDLVYLGDAWSLVHVMANRLQLSEERRQEAFFRVRREMLADANGFVTFQELYRTIAGLNHIQAKILVTNSPAETGKEFITALGCLEAFDEIHYSAGKPLGMESYMQQLMQQRSVSPGQILSIGDHAWNDLHPVRKLGGRTVCISPYGSTDPEVWDVSLRSLEELNDFLRKLQQARMTSAAS